MHDVTKWTTLRTSWLGNVGCLLDRRLALWHNNNNNHSSHDVASALDTATKNAFVVERNLPSFQELHILEIIVFPPQNHDSTKLLLQKLIHVFIMIRVECDHR